LLKYTLTNKRKKMKNIYSVCGATSVLFALSLGITGCASPQTPAQTLQGTMDDRDKAVSVEKSYQRTSMNMTEPKLGKRISISFKNTPAYLAVQKVSRNVGLKFDTTFAPSSEYRVTASFNGSVEDFFNLVYRQTGVEYKFRNGLVSVFNKDYIEKEYRAGSCHDKGAKKFEIALRAVPPSKVFDYFIENRNFSVSYDTKYSNVSGNELDKKAINNVSFFYKGCDEREAISRFGKANDLSIKFNGAKSFVVKDYEMAKLDVPSYFKVKFDSSGAGLGDAEGGGGSGSSVSEEEDYQKEMKDMVSTYLSPLGKAFLSNRGYLIVTDRPSNIKEIKSIIQKEVGAQQSMDLSISIIRVDVSDDFKNGVDWSTALAELGRNLDIRNLSLGMGYAGAVEGGLSVSGIINNKQQIVNVLSKYGNAKIVRDYSVSTRSGILSTFKAVQKIPYVTTSVIQNGQTSQTVAEAKEVEAGLILTVKPTLSQNNEMVNIAISATVSEYLGDKAFDVGGGQYLLPQITSNEIQMPANVPINKTVILTGLKLKNSAVNREGIPRLSKLDTVGGLFGLNEEVAEASEFLLVVTPKVARRY